MRLLSPKWTAAERVQARGWCLGGVDVTSPGDVGLDKRANCPRCGKRVAVTVRGLFAHHKPEPQTGGTSR